MKSSLEPIRLSATPREIRLAQMQNGQIQPDLQDQLRGSYEKGFSDGQKALGEQLLRQRNDMLELKNGILASLNQALPQVRAEMEVDLVELALAVAQRLVAGLPISHELVEAVVREALSQVQEANEITVLLHAEDLELLQRADAAVLSSPKDGHLPRFQASPEVTRGGCVVRTRFGSLDARRETKCELLGKVLHG